MISRISDAQIAFITLGCAKNEVDTAHMQQRLRACGFSLTEDPEQADALIINTCSFIQSATEESLEAIFEAAGYENINAGAPLIVAGCMPARYGDELADDITPIEAGLGIFVKLDKPDFIGKDAIAAQKAEGVKRKLVGIELQDRAIPRHGYEILNADDEVVGHVTTGYHAISVDKSIAMALVDAKYAALGTELKVRIRRKTFPAVVVKKKFYKKSYKQ